MGVIDYPQVSYTHDIYTNIITKKYQQELQFYRLLKKDLNPTENPLQRLLTTSSVHIPSQCLENIPCIPQIANF